MLVKQRKNLKLTDVTLGETRYIAMVVQRQPHELYWVAPLRGSIPQSQLILPYNSAARVFPF